MAPSETSPLIRPEQERRDSVPPIDKSAVDGNTLVDEEIPSATPDAVIIEQPRNTRAIITIFLLGVFVANADGSLVFATNETISSEFDRLADTGWIVISYGLASCAVQPLYGKLSDIYGRKSLLILSYMIFTVGCALCGLGWTFWLVVVGRVITGVAGAGMTVLVSILITDMVPMRDVASWRSYVNIAATTGRSLGGPLGGYLAETIGWRWSFTGQCPPTILAAILVMWKLPSRNPPEEFKESAVGKLRRIDFLGSVLLATSMICFILVMDLAGQQMQWKAPSVIALAILSPLLGVLFLLVEAYWAKEPIFPLRLLISRDAFTAYFIAGAQMAAQVGIMFTVPLYFQTSANASATVGGAHLFPAVAGNAIGSILVGILIKRTGRYRLPTIVGLVAASIGYLLLSLRWHGRTNIWESMYIVPGGFGTGVALSTTFIVLTASVDPSDVAVAAAGLYQAANIGAVVGLSVTDAIIQGSVRFMLDRKLQGFEEKSVIIERSMSDISYIQGLTGKIRNIVVQSYVQGVTYTHVFSLVCSSLAGLTALLIREHKL